MDTTTLNTVVGIIGIIVGLIGVIVGVIGWKSLTTATKIKNNARTGNGSTVQQANSIHNGLDSYTVIKLSKETAQQELEKTSITREELEKILDEQPKILCGTTLPDHMRDGDIFFIIEEGDTP